MEDYQGTRGEGDLERGLPIPRRFREDFTQYSNAFRGQLAGQIHQYQDRLTTSLPDLSYYTLNELKKAEESSSSAAS